MGVHALTSRNEGVLENVSYEKLGIYPVDPARRRAPPQDEVNATANATAAAEAAEAAAAAAREVLMFPW